MLFILKPFFNASNPSIYSFSMAYTHQNRQYFILIT